MPEDDEREPAWPAQDTDRQAQQPAGEGAGKGQRTPDVDGPTMWLPQPEAHAKPMRIEPQGQWRPAASTPAVPVARIPRPGSGPPGAQPEQRQPEQRQPEQSQPEGPGPASGQAVPSGQPGDAPDRGPRRRLRGLLVGGLALLLVVAVGVVLALPPVSNRLALPWAPNAPKSDPPEPVPVARTLHASQTEQGGPTPQGVAAAVRQQVSNPALGTLSGSVLDPATGQVLWSKEPGKPMTPASTTKLLTAAAALLALDHDQRIPTTVRAGSEPGSIVLQPHGDVTLSSLPEGKESVYPSAAHLDQLVAEVEQATGGNVRSVAIDLSAFSGPPTAPGWDPGDAPSTFASPVVPGMLDGGRSNPADEHAQRVQDPASVLLSEFADRLGAEVSADPTTVAPANAQVLGEVRSAPVTTLVQHLLVQSDNVLADAMARQVAIARGAEPSFAGAANTVRAVLAENGFDVSGLTLNDGSGLSELNKAPAGLLAQILATAAGPAGKDARTAKLRPLLGGLPVAGGTGTLAQRYQQQPAAPGRGWVRAKTGTLSGVNTLAGTVLDADGRVLVFALMSGGTDPAQARPALDAVAAALRGCGCS